MPWSEASDWSPREPDVRLAAGRRGERMLDELERAEAVLTVSTS